jgi:ABC-type phosphate transport system substrate-binding protein
MKTIKYAVAAVALTTLSFGAFAAQSVSPSQASGMNKIGVVSAEGATTLDGLEAQLAEKAAAAGASGYLYAHESSPRVSQKVPSPPRL